MVTVKVRLKILSTMLLSCIWPFQAYLLTQNSLGVYLSSTSVEMVSFNKYFWGQQELNPEPIGLELPMFSTLSRPQGRRTTVLMPIT